MRVDFLLGNYCGKNTWFCIFPSIGVGYYKKFISITLYFFIWEFSINIDFDYESKDNNRTV